MATALQIPLVPSLHEMSRAVDHLCGKDTIGTSRRKQLRALVGAYERAFALGGLPPDAYDDLATLLTTEVTEAFLDLAARGLVRGDGKRDRESDSQIRARGRCLQLIAAHAGIPFELPPMPPSPEPAPIVTAPVRSLLMRHFAHQVDREVTEPFRLRFLAMYGIVLDTASSSGTLVGQHVAHLAGDHSSIRIQRPAAGRSPVPPPPEEWPLSPATRQAIAAYLPLRKTLVEPLENPVRHLWVTLEHNHTGRDADGNPIVEPPGLPLKARGVQRVFARAAEVLNTEMEKLNEQRGAPQIGEAPEWEPMPTRLEPIRRAVAAELEQREEHQGGVQQLVLLRGTAR
ncbi:hypothetical protein ABZ726_27210 [Streptomyces hundungensis]|uniref:hypothetical protein n=1 Tax=Streptomyces hundungensis TaxID=1077946 RepID=UPI0033FE98E9